MPKLTAHLSERDIQILDVVQQNASISVDDISKIVKLRPHVVRRSIERLRNAKAIIPYAPIHTAALGFTEYQVILRLNGDYGAATKALVDRLLQHEHVAVVGELAGELEFTLWARNATHFGSMFDELLAHVSPRVSRTVLIRRWFYGLGFRIVGSGKRSGVLLEPSEKMMQIDETDHQILKAVCTTGSHTAAEIGRVAGCPSSTVSYRINRMLSDGVLLEPRYSVDVRKVGRSRMRVRIAVQSASAVRKKLVEAVQRIAPVSLVCEVIGPWDFELDVSLTDGVPINDVLAMLSSVLGNAIKSIEVVPHSDYKRISNYPFRRYPF
jgi:DNA-binding Lrp family transcriptional regulator